MDTGQPVSVFGNSPLVVDAGTIVHTPSNPTHSAGYLQIELGSAVTRIGATAKWNQDANGAVTLVLPVSPWGPDGGFPVDAAAQADAALHLVLYGNGIWHVSYFTAGSVATERKYAHGRFSDVRDGQWRAIDVQLDGTIASISLPDGSVVEFEDDALASVSTTAVWELYEPNQGFTPATLGTLWADD